MSRCDRCGKNLGFGYPGVKKTVAGRQLNLCLSCAIPLYSELKAQAIAELYQTGEPTPKFMIFAVALDDPDSKTNILLGHLIFTDKAICFAKLSDIDKGSVPTNYQSNMVWMAMAARTGSQIGSDVGNKIGGLGEGGGFVGGVAGAIIWDLATYKSRQKEKLRAQETMKIIDDQVNSMPTEGQPDLKQILDKAKEIYLFPKNLIVKIKYSRDRGLEVELREYWYKKTYFRFSDEMYQQLKLQLEQYLS
jgi:hypothetical protein